MCSHHSLYTYRLCLYHCLFFIFHDFTSLWLLGTSTLHCIDVLSDNISISFYEKKDEKDLLNCCYCFLAPMNLHGLVYTYMYHGIHTYNYNTKVNTSIYVPVNPVSHIQVVCHVPLYQGHL